MNLTPKRRCTKCGKYKKLTEFYRQRSKASGYYCQCKLCVSKWMHLPENRAKKAASERKRKAKNRKKWNAKARGYYLKSRLKNYGMGLSEYDHLLNLQNGKCAICGRNKPINGHKRFCLDHDHRTGKLRGLLCIKCNLGMGNFDDNPEIIKAALAYLTNVPNQ